MLEDIWPNLKQDVTPKIPAIFPEFKIPNDVQTIYIKNMSNACDAIQSILDAGEGVLGFDAEWDVVFVNRRVIRGKVAIIQIAFKSNIYLFHIAVFGIPENLKTLLASESFLKTGRNVGGDLKKLQDQFDLEYNSQSVVELGTLCSNKGIANGHSSLAAFCEATLNLSLPKPQDIRISNWSNRNLSKEQLEYAALDAYCSLKVYEKAVQHVSKNTRLTSDISRVGMAVSIYRGEKYLGHGVIVKAKSFWSVKPTPKRSFVKIVRSQSKASFKNDILVDPDENIYQILTQRLSFRNDSIPLVQEQNDDTSNNSTSTSDSFIQEMEREANQIHSRVLGDLFHLMDRVHLI